jgi:hypothetical protein
LLSPSKRQVRPAMAIFAKRGGRRRREGGRERERARARERERERARASERARPRAFGGGCAVSWEDSGAEGGRIDRPRLATGSDHDVARRKGIEEGTGTCLAAK